MGLVRLIKDSPKTTPDTTVAEAVRIMVRANRGSMAIVNEHRIVGIFTERDLMKRIVHEGRDPTGIPLGEVMTTKPYVSGAAYIDRMSDYCKGCRFSPKKDCPITPMYWAFLGRHESKLADNMRLKLPLASMRKRAEEKKSVDRETFERVRSTLAVGDELEPTS